MAYLGNVPARSFISFERQVFTIVNSQTAYTLSHSVTNENDIRLVVNNVVQEPGSGKAYTASGTTLTLSAALTNGTDEMYCVFLGRAVGTVNAPAASVGNSQTAPTIITGQTAETSIATDDLILLSDTSASGALKKMTRANFVSGVGGTNTPAFEANLSANQNISDATYVKVEFNTEVFDTDNCYDNSTNYRFTPTVAGKYFVYSRLQLDSQATSNFDQGFNRIYKNGSVYSQTQMNMGNNQPENLMLNCHATIDMNGSSDYIEIFAYLNDTSGTPTVRGTSYPWSIFGAYKLIGV